LEVQSPFVGVDGWLVSDDEAVVGEDGSFSLVKRVDCVVKLEEKRVSLVAVDAHLKAHAFVKDAVALVVDVDGRQVIGAVVVLSAEGQKALEADGKRAVVLVLREFLMPFYDGVVLPKLFRFVDDFVVNAQGKRSRAALLPLFEERVVFPVVESSKVDGDEVVLSLFVPEDLFYFKGHFPVAPVLPGVVQLDWAVLFFRQFFDVPFVFDGMDVVKFQQLIRPGMVVELVLKNDVVKRRFSFCYESESGRHASGKVCYV